MYDLKKSYLDSELRAAVHPVIGRRWIQEVELDEMVYVMDNCSQSTFKALLEIDDNYGYSTILKLINITQNGEVAEINDQQSREIVTLATNAFLDEAGNGCDYPYNS